MDHFNDVLTTFLCFDHGSTLAVYGGSESSQKYLNLGSEDEQRSYGFGTTWGRVINDIIFFFGWTIPLTALYGNLRNCIFIVTTASCEILKPKGYKEIIYQKWKFAENLLTFRPSKIIFLIIGTDLEKFYITSFAIALHYQWNLLNVNGCCLNEHSSSW